MTLSKPILAASLIFGIIGVFLGAASTVFLRISIVTAASTGNTSIEASTLVEQLLISPEIEPARRFVQDYPNQINTPHHGMLPILVVTALWPNEIDLVEYLLDVGADPTLSSSDALSVRRHSALSYAAWMGDEKLLNIFLERMRNNESFGDKHQVLRAKSIVELEHPHLLESLPWH